MTSQLLFALHATDALICSNIMHLCQVSIERHTIVMNVFSMAVLRLQILITMT